MDKFFTYAKKLRRSRVISAAGLSAAAMLLVVAAVFISGGGTAKVSRALLASGIVSGSPASLLALSWCSVFHCNSTSYALEALVPMQGGVPVSSVAPGTAVDWIWNAGSYGANYFLPVCRGRSAGSEWDCSVALSAPNTNFGSCYYSYTEAGQCLHETCTAYTKGVCSQTACDQWSPDVYHPSTGCHNADTYFGSSCYGSAGGYPPNYSCPGYSGNTPGTLVMTAPSTPGSYTYYFCSSWLMSHASLGCVGTTLAVEAPPVPAPTLAIDAGAGPGVSRTVSAGTPVPISATFAPGSGDTITKSSIVDSGSNTVPGVSTAVPPTAKSYTFVPAAAGSYVFYPSVQTASYPAWSNYGKSVTITVAGAGDLCTDILGTQAAVPPGCTGPTPPPSGACVPAGSTYDGSACVPATACTGAHQVGTPPNCSCDVGFQMQGGACVQVVCPGPHEVNWPACTCAAGYARDAGTSMCIREPVLSIKVNGLDATRVRKGNTVAVTWSASGVAAGSCRVTTNAGVTLGSSESGSASPAVANQTAYRLTCLNDAGATVSREANVTLIPEVIEQ